MTDPAAPQDEALAFSLGPGSMVTLKLVGHQTGDTVMLFRPERGAHPNKRCNSNHRGDERPGHLVEDAVSAINAHIPKPASDTMT